MALVGSNSTGSKKTIKSHQERRSIVWSAYTDVQGSFGSFKEEYELSLREPENIGQRRRTRSNGFKSLRLFAS
eukprot:scaffold3337_cov169-Amphora_coffeaeformis.AAC.24